MKPTVSIIVLTRNRSKFLTRCLSSISDQLYDGGYEVLVLMDGCTDDTKDMLEMWKMGRDNRKIVEMNWSNGELDTGAGIGYAAHIGVKMAQGEYICRLDDDDWWSRQFLGTMVAAMESNPKKVAASCWYDTHKRGGALTPNQPYPMACNIMWRATALKDVNYDINKKRDEEVDLIKRMERAYGLDFMVTIPISLYRYWKEEQVCSIAGCGWRGENLIKHDVQEHTGRKKK